MLSFVMDDPDFESDSDTPRRVVRNPKDAPRGPWPEGVNVSGSITVRPELPSMCDHSQSPGLAVAQTQGLVWGPSRGLVTCPGSRGV